MDCIAEPYLSKSGVLVVLSYNDDKLMMKHILWIMVLILGTAVGCCQETTTSDTENTLNEGDTHMMNKPEHDTTPLIFTDTIALHSDFTHDVKSAKTLYEALQLRRSCVMANMTDSALDKRTVSHLLWAAYGYNRITNGTSLPHEGKLTAPSSMNSQEITLYVSFAEGTYRYANAYDRLERVSEKDLRYAIAGHQPEAAQAFLLILVTADKAKLRAQGAEAKLRAALIDGGIVSQNISLFCAAAGLHTRARTSMDEATLRKELSLGEDIELVINHPVSY